MQQLTEAQAIALADTKWWEGKTPQEIVTFQLFTDLLCMPFAKFHEAVEAALGRPVWTHEFAFPGRIEAEFLGQRPAPTFDEILALIPEEKRVLVCVEEAPADA